MHNRPIVRHVDDSIVRILLGRELVLRRARGYAPLPLSLGQAAPVMLAVGAHLKNTVALSVGKNIFVSQHIGDLETAEASEAFRGVIASFRGLYQVQPEVVVADMHPDYLSTKFARSCGRPVIAVQHHYAHIAACMAENELDGPVLGVSWDGTGYGTDGTIWGGEFLVADAASFRRVATLRSFRLPGGASAIKEPRRSAVGALYEIMGDALFERDDLAPLRSFSRGETAILRRMLAQAVNSPVTSSAGRLFDAVAAITGLRQRQQLRRPGGHGTRIRACRHRGGRQLSVSLKAPGAAAGTGSLLILDWGPMMLALHRRSQAGLGARDRLRRAFTIPWSRSSSPWPGASRWSASPCRAAVFKTGI